MLGYVERIKQIRGSAPAYGRTHQPLCEKRLTYKAYSSH